MVVQLNELGPFGSRINEGLRESVEDIPEGYEVIRIETHFRLTIIIIEPTL